MVGREERREKREERREQGKGEIGGTRPAKAEARSARAAGLVPLSQQPTYREPLLHLLSDSNR
eukprot:1705795-Rhodomonas_salina.1